MRYISEFFDGVVDSYSLRDRVVSRREGHLLANSIVKIKSWEDLLDAGSLDEIGNIELDNVYFTCGMRRLCGLDITLDEYAMYDGWIIESSMCEMIDYWAAVEDDEEDYWGDNGAFCIDLDVELAAGEEIDLSNTTVTIKDWNEMLRSGSIDRDGDIFLGLQEAYFTNAMRPICGKVLVLDDEGHYKDWVISPAMCKRIKYSRPYHTKSTDEFCSSSEFDTTKLETGMIIKDGYNKLSKFYKGTRFGDLFIYENGTWNKLDKLEEHWEKGEYLDYKFCEVYSPDSVVGLVGGSWDLSKDYKLVWLKKELVPEERVPMSLEEIEEELGYRIKLTEKGEIRNV